MSVSMAEVLVEGGFVCGKISVNGDRIKKRHPCFDENLFFCDNSVEKFKFISELIYRILSNLIRTFSQFQRVKKSDAD